MNCFGCKCNVEEVGGTTMDGCSHLLCTECIVKAAKKTCTPGIKCPAVQGVYKCNGQISHEDLQYMISEEDYNEYTERTVSAVVGDAGINNNRDASAKQKTTLRDLNLTQDEKESGWAHKASLVDELVRFDGMTREEALQHLDRMPLIVTRGVIRCEICLDDEVPSGEGVVLKDCDHMFCKECIKGHISNSDTAEVTCPFVDGDYKCEEPLKAGEVKALVDDTAYDKYLEKSLKSAEGRMENAFHCKTPDCAGWCVYDAGVTHFDCPICRKRNCILCQAIHDGTCEDYKNRIQQNANERLTEAALEELIRKGEYMRCPKCQIPVQKVVGCDWLQCTCCKTEICWATRGPRWGPKGRGDITGGCRCRVNLIPCTPTCGNCH